MATARSRRCNNESDAIEMLEDDHGKVEKLFARFEKSDRDDVEARASLVEQACAALEVHAAVEEELFYPAARRLGDDTSLLNEALVEHDIAKQLIARIDGLDPADPMYAATFTVLAEYIRHHVEEEEGELFPKLKKARLDLEELGADALAQGGADG
jgi:hemerythrin superfamily protein